MDELGKTVVIVIHDINFASCYSDHIVALKDGELMKIGETEEIIKKEVENSRSYYKTNRNHRPTITLKIADLHKMLDFNKFV